MAVRRGPGGDGVNAVKCDSCHQSQNVPGIHTPPGAPGWHLPPAANPLIWEGLSDRQLCELLNNRKQNGSRTPQQIVEHMSSPLVMWGWHPGEGRTPVAMPQKEFVAKVQEWATAGAGCPDR